jgi:hypothetical protein
VPIFYYRCPEGCRLTTMSHTAPTCKEHNLPCNRLPLRSVTTTQMETIDNGLQVRKVETYVGVQEMVSERSKLDPRLTRDTHGEQGD